MSFSGAIARYLASTKACDPKWYPEEPQKRAKLNQFISWNHRHIRQAVNLFLNEVVWKPLQGIPEDKELSNNTRQKLEASLGILNNSLQQSTFLVGDSVSLADLMIAEELVNLDLIQYDFTSFLNVIRWLKQVKSSVSCWEKVHQFFNQVYLPAVRKSLGS
jgi:glutathione S-transferase